MQDWNDIRPDPAEEVIKGLVTLLLLHSEDAKSQTLLNSVILKRMYNFILVYLSDSSEFLASLL